MISIRAKALQFLHTPTGSVSIPHSETKGNFEEPWLLGIIDGTKWTLLLRSRHGESSVARRCRRSIPECH